MTSFTQAEEGHLQSLLRDDRHLSFPPASAQSSSAVETMEMKDLRGEHMFDKVVTPSDVGKLNRLVIPKHHAQKYFPLDTNAKEKGLMLPFHDSTGKEWRFRYSYWSSSQSYVLTKGWSRFVREMKLHAGDVVSFHRAADSRNVVRLYISWRRRASKAALFFSHGRGGRTGKAQHLSNGEASMAAVAPLRVEQANGQAGHLMTVDMFGDGQINCNTPAVYDGRGQSWSRELLPQFMELKPAERPPGDRSYAAEKPAATGSNKRVRLFGVTLNE